MKKIILTIIALGFAVTAQAYDGKIVDAQTKAPIAGAIVTLGNDAVLTQANGTFHIDGTGPTLKLRAPGYTRQDVATSTLDGKTDIQLNPFKVKALYLTAYGMSSRTLRNAAFDTIQRNGMNSLVIDVKDDRGYIPFKVNIPLADQIGAQNKILIKDMPALVASLKEKHLYLIARIVTFKDNLLATAKPDLAVRKNGAMFTDREKLHWVDPFKEETWAYNIAIAKAAADAGFDEVQFDYVRFPDNKGVTFSQPSTQDSRTKAISGFLTAAHKALVPDNVMLAADIFGYVPWNYNDTYIGQDINKLVDAVDIISPMLYPSGFQFGIPNYENPVKNSYQVVHNTLQKAQNRTKISPLRFRPWLQAFRDYAFGREFFAEDKMQLQIKAANDFGASGYMFWNPRNVYPKGKFES